ncbi:MAG: nicotinate phosphoribosyltransferase [Dehalococcoidia bacterium]|nr:nicotinate phosphoribosyltransferase [Dehalococcoidia bacterium]
MWHATSYEDVKQGRVTDVYFQRALEVLLGTGTDKRVRAEFVAKTLPEGWPWAVLAGIEECAHLLEGLRVTVRALPEGTVFRPLQPVLEVEGRYTEFGALETALLGMLCQVSGVATKAARFRKLAGDTPVTSFGARRIHPAIAPAIERAAYIGGCSGVATVAAAQMLGIEPTGTMPHALVLLMGSTVDAALAFNRIIDRSVRRIVLIDTFNDEKFEAVNVANALGDDLFAIRLDTPASRRGDFRQILQEVRWELDLRGYQHVHLFASGGLSEASVPELAGLVDGFGVGTEVSNAPVVDFAMDIIEVDGEPLAKRGKLSGAKSLWRCTECQAEHLTPRGERPNDPHPDALIDILVPLLAGGVVVANLPSPQAIRARVLQELSQEQAIEPTAQHRH